MIAIQVKQMFHAMETISIPESWSRIFPNEKEREKKTVSYQIS